jgi:hypothetical protein
VIHNRLNFKKFGFTAWIQSQESSTLGFFASQIARQLGTWLRDEVGFYNAMQMKRGPLWSCLKEGTSNKAVREDEDRTRIKGEGVGRTAEA